MRRLPLGGRKISPRAVTLRVEGLENRLLLTATLPTIYAVPQAISRPLSPAQQAEVPSGYTTDIPSVTPAGVAGPATSVAYTPAQIRQAYGINQLSETGAGQTIAIVDAYDLTTANITKYLTTFDNQFGLPAANLTVATPEGIPTNLNSGWETEIALDVEWAHAIAPAANILLVETLSASYQDLLDGVLYAAQQGAAQVSMSWGGSEFSDAADETAADSYFQTPGVTFVASSGDTASQVDYPAASPYVVGVGGTSLYLNSSGNYSSESAWADGGGGVSALEAQPTYQEGFSTSTNRAIPDVAFDADPSTGVYIYDNGFGVVGGTSVGAPQWAGLFALANQGRVADGEATLGPTQTTTETNPNYGTNTLLYQLAGGTSYTNPNGDYHDVTTGSNGHPATTGYDLATGLGSPVANQLIPNLITPPTQQIGGGGGGGLPTIGDFGFEAVPVGNGSYVYDPTGSAWTFATSAGLAGNNSGFSGGNGPAPQGAQVAFLQQVGTISQSVSGWAAGSYTISFDAAQRGNVVNQQQDFDVLIDGKVVSTFTPTGSTYQVYTTSSFTVTAGAHTIEFLGLNGSGGDNTALLDDVTVASA
jgi:subtilase family serine protease